MLYGEEWAMVMLRRVLVIGVVWMALGAGCAFTSRPMIPLDESMQDGGSNPTTNGGGGDAGRVTDAGSVSVDVWVPPFGDAGAAAAPDAAEPGFDDCVAVQTDGGDGGFRGRDGGVCEVTEGDSGVDTHDAHGDVTDVGVDGALSRGE